MHDQPKDPYGQTTSIGESSKEAADSAGTRPTRRSRPDTTRDGRDNGDGEPAAECVTGCTSSGRKLLHRRRLPHAGAVPVVLKVNGKEYRLSLDPRTTVLDALRENLNLFGTKKGCDHGQCGACTVHINGRRVNSCLTFAVMHQADQITTIEGLARQGQLHPVQVAFVEFDGFQCGYCTPGQIMSGAALLNEPVGQDNDSVREMMSGNLCRCGAYDNIVAAVQSARRKA